MDFGNIRGMSVKIGNIGNDRKTYNAFRKTPVHLVNGRYDDFFRKTSIFFIITADTYRDIMEFAYVHTCIDIARTFFKSIKDLLP